MTGAGARWRCLCDELTFRMTIWAMQELSRLVRLAALLRAIEYMFDALVTINLRCQKMTLPLITVCSALRSTPNSQPSSLF